MTFEEPDITETWRKRNEEGKCALCDVQLQGQSYLYSRGWIEPPIMICQKCMTEQLDKRIKSVTEQINMYQTTLKDYTRRKEKVLKGEPL
jgi:hypothetical protein